MTQVDQHAFEHAEGFVPNSELLGIELGPLEMAYQELFADVLADGVITPEERMVLEKAAQRMGLDRERLTKLEQAMLTAFEAHHRVRVVEQSNVRRNRHRRWRMPRMRRHCSPVSANSRRACAISRKN